MPITFLHQFSSHQFRIVGSAMGWTAKAESEEWKKLVGYKHDVISEEGTRSYAILNGSQRYHRILIQRLQEV